MPSFGLFQALADSQISNYSYNKDEQRKYQYAFNELRMHCLYAEVLTYNHVSQSLFEHCGFKKDGILRSRVYKYGAYQDMIAYSIIKDDVKK